MSLRILLALLGLVACQPNPAPLPAPIAAASTTADSLPPKPPQKNSQDTFWIAAVGDMVPGISHPWKYFPPEEGKTIFSELLPYLQSPDLTFGNFEGVIEGIEAKPKICYDPKVCYRFRIPQMYVDRIKEAGFDLLNISCNHVDDFGPKGRYWTEDYLQKQGFYAVGLEERPCTTFQAKGLTIGFCAYAPFMGCAKFRDSLKVKQQLLELDSLCDLLIVSMHGGSEGPAFRNVPKKDEIFLEFNRGNMHRFAHMAIEHGADLVLGHGPHVTRALELHRGRLIAYSLGNFCTYGAFGLNRYTATAPLLQVGLDPQTGKLLAARAIPIKQIERGLPRYDSSHTAIYDLQFLTKADFPTTPLQIDSSGWIFPRQ
jgi:hypothetical protein